MESPPRYLRPTAPAADRAIVVGDPGRALFLAQELLAPPPPMFNHHRGFWGYSGEALIDRRPMIVQGTGLGATSTNAVVEDLIGMGVRRFVRVGTCTALDGVEIGDLITVSCVIGRDGVSSKLSASEAVFPHPGLREALDTAIGSQGRPATVQSEDFGHQALESSSGAAAWDLATASLLASASSLGVEAAAVLVVARDDSESIEDDRLGGLVRSAGQAAATALSHD